MTSTDGFLPPDVSTVAVLVLSEGESDSVGACIEALGRQTYRRDRMDIVVLGDVDAAALSGASNSVRHYPSSPSGCGTTTLRDAIQGTYGEVIACIGGACVAEPAWLERLVSTMQEFNPAIIGGRVVAADHVDHPPAGFPAQFQAHFSTLADHGTDLKWGVPPGMLLSPHNLAFWRESFEAVEETIQTSATGKDSLQDAVRRVAFEIQCTAPGTPYCGTAVVHSATGSVPAEIIEDPARAARAAGLQNTWSLPPDRGAPALIRQIGLSRYRSMRSAARGAASAAALWACYGAYARGQLAWLHANTSIVRAYIVPLIAALRDALSITTWWTAWWPRFVLRSLAFLCKTPLRKRATERPVQRVLTVTPTYFGPGSIVGGGERAASDLAKAIGRKVEMTLLSFGSEKREENVDGVRSCTLKTAFLVDGRILNPWTLSVLSEIKRVDVVHCHQPRTMIIDLCILLACFLGKKVFVTDHGAHEQNGFYELDLQRFVTRFLVVADYTAHAFGFPLEKTTAIYNGIEPDILMPAPEKKKRKVLFVGRITPGKGIHYLVQAVDPETETVIIGKPDGDEYYEKLLKLSEGMNVTYILGTDSYEELREHYQSAAVTVLSSFNNDLFPMVILESFACGTPAICSNAGGTPELVIHGVNGFLTPIRSPRAVGERINFLLDHPDVARSMGEAGRKLIVEKFTWDSVAAACLDAYERFPAPE